MNIDSNTHVDDPQGLGSHRQAQIAEIVRNHGQARVDELAAHFSVSTQTIRKDINEMCERGLLRRVHGGVELASLNAEHYALRRILNLRAKRRIGMAAADLIPEGATLAVSIGTTPELAVASLGLRRNLKIFTNNLHVAMSARRFEDVVVTIPGGQLRESEADIVGPSATSFFDAYQFDLGLFGVAAVDEAGTLLDLSEQDVQSRDAIARNARACIPVLDASKFGRQAHVRSGHITQAEHVICDARPPEAICQLLEEAVVNLIVCDEAEP